MQTERSEAAPVFRWMLLKWKLNLGDRSDNDRVIGGKNGRESEVCWGEAKSLTLTFQHQKSIERHRKIAGSAVEPAETSGRQMQPPEIIID